MADEQLREAIVELVAIIKHQMAGMRELAQELEELKTAVGYATEAIKEHRETLEGEA